MFMLFRHKMRYFFNNNALFPIVWSKHVAYNLQHVLVLSGDGRVAADCNHLHVAANVFAALTDEQYSSSLYATIGST